MEEVQKYHRFLVRVDSTVFNLSSLLLVQEMVLKIRPQYTQPIFVVSFDVGVDDIDVTDQLELRGTLHLNDTLCRHGSPMYDDARPGGGGYWNQFDTDDDPATPPPGTPPPDPVAWGYDKGYCCPEDTLSADLIMTFGAPWIVAYDTILKFDEPALLLVQFEDTGPYVFPVGTPHAVAPKTTAVAALDGTVQTARIRIIGDGPGPQPAPPAPPTTDYEFVVELDDGFTVTEIASKEFDATDLFIETDIVINPPVPIVAGNTLIFSVRIPAGSPHPGPRTPLWTHIWGSVMIADASWNYGDTLPAGTYLNRNRPLT
jgi:hypothetical protein